VVKFVFVTLKRKGTYKLVNELNGFTSRNITIFTFQAVQASKFTLLRLG